MTFFERVKVFFKEDLRYPRIYFAKSIKSVPPGAFILFPVQDSQLNCGLTGIVALKKKEIAKSKIPINKTESMILHINGYTYRKIREENGNLIDNYLGGETFIKELQDLIWDLKLTPSLYRIFREAPTRKKLEKGTFTLERTINGEENEYHQISTSDHLI